MVKRVLILIGVALVVGLVIGNVSGYALKTHITAKDKQKTEEQTLERSSTKTLVYGAYDDRTSHRKYLLTGVRVTWTSHHLTARCRKNNKNLHITFVLGTTLILPLLWH